MQATLSHTAGFRGDMRQGQADASPAGCSGTLQLGAGFLDLWGKILEDPG